MRKGVVKDPNVLQETFKCNNEFKRSLDKLIVRSGKSRSEVIRECIKWGAKPYIKSLEHQVIPNDISDSVIPNVVEHQVIPNDISDSVIPNETESKLPTIKCMKDNFICKEGLCSHVG